MSTERMHTHNQSDEVDTAFIHAQLLSQRSQVPWSQVEVSVQICSGVPSLGEEKQVTEATTKRHNEADLVFPLPVRARPT